MVVVDAFCGVGGNAVHFARRCAHVIGIDHCAPRLALAHQNAGVYGVADCLDLLCADYFDLRDQLKATPSRKPCLMLHTQCCACVGSWTFSRWAQCQPRCGRNTDLLMVQSAKAQVLCKRLVSLLMRVRTLVSSKDRMAGAGGCSVHVSAMGRPQLLGQDI